MKKYDVQCSTCCGSFHATTKKFSKDGPANGSMFKLKQEYVTAGWESFPEYDTTEYADVVCPSCGGAYLDSSGRVIRLQEVKEEVPPDISPVKGTTSGGETEIEDIIAVIKTLNSNDEAHWTNAGLPDARVLTDLLNKRVTAKLRDEAWAIIQTTNNE